MAESIYISINEHIEDGLSIGGLIKKIIDRVDPTHNRVLLRVANAYWHGSFTVPDAVGFSTPLSICKDGTLHIYSDPTSTEKPFAMLNNWSNTYRSIGCRKDDVFNFTSSHGECLICTCQYQVGDSLIKLEACGHVYHRNCQKTWVLKNHTKQDIIKAMVMETRLVSQCPMCNKATS